MRRHVLVGRFGVTDRVVVPTAPDEVATLIELVTSKKGLGYGLGKALRDLRMLGVYPSEVGLDVAIVAAHVHAADTRIKRETEAQDSWTREIRLVVPVSDPARWMRATPFLKRALDFLTGDRWELGFRARPRGFSVLVPRFPEVRPSTLSRFDTLTLFSGGLDSLIGTIDSLFDGRTPLLVSHYGDGATSDAQNKCFAALRKRYPAQRFARLRVGLKFPRDLVRGVAPEDSTRGRSFLFFALGVFAGTGLPQSFVLRAPENGLIALNVPLDPLRLGSNSTRTTHPFYIGCWNEILEVLGIGGRIENPYWHKTKGEMVSGCADADILRALAPHAMSCASPAKARWLQRGIEHCGYCLPCLIRRAALRAAWGDGNDPTRYTLADLHARRLDTEQAEGIQVRSFQMATARLRSRPGDARILIHKPGPLPANPAERETWADVYRRGLEEVGALLDGVRAGPG